MASPQQSRHIAWEGPPIHVVGMGMDQGMAMATASAPARHLLATADCVIGAQAHLSALPDDLTVQKCPFPSPLGGIWALLREQMGRQIILLASGDPLFYGIGATLLRRLAPEHLVFHPNVTSVQAACARWGKPWERVRLLSLHGRPLVSLRAMLHNRQFYAILTDSSTAPFDIAKIAISCGFEDSHIFIAEHLGMADERCQSFHVAELVNTPVTFSRLNVVLLETQGSGGILPEFPGIPDRAFSTGTAAGQGLLTKREVRLTILSWLAPCAGDVGWDVGAGCGGVAVEWARWNPAGTVHAVECHTERFSHLQINREHFGVVFNLRTHLGHAPEGLGDLPDPDAVFIGGSGGHLPEILQTAWERLKPGGRLVASAVTEDSRVELHLFAQKHPAEWVEIAVSRHELLVGQRILRPALPVLLMKMEKLR